MYLASIVYDTQEPRITDLHRFSLTQPLLISAAFSRNFSLPLKNVGPPFRTLGTDDELLDPQGAADATLTF